MRIHVEQCPICKNNILSPLVKCTDFYVSKKQFEIVRCENCDFKITQNFPSQDSIGKYYEAENYISHSDTKKGLMNKLYHWVRSYSLKQKVKLVQKSSNLKTGSLLDFGAGTGYFLNAMKEKHWIVTGVEKDKDAREFALSKFDLHLQEEEFLYELPNNQKDVVTMWHVLEHIETFDTLMIKMHHVLKKNGTFIIAIPNADSYDAKYYKEFWAAYDVPRHLWHFSPKNFELVAQKYGFEIISIKPMHFDVFYISMLSEKYKKAFLPTFIGGLKGFWFFCKNICFNRKASSLIYILKKK